MSPDDFRRIALGMAGAIERAHMGHPDFRAPGPKGRIFATLHADNEWGMVKLTPEQQRAFIHEYPVAFAPESGAWGRSGSTAVRLDSVEEDALGEAMTLAWRNATVKAPTKSPSAARTRVSTKKKKRPARRSTGRRK
jgi:hypothetical protein